jgi:hypothetical protein
VVPVVTRVGRATVPDDRQRSMVQALTAVLAREPGMRAGLGDEARCRRLVADVTASWVGDPARRRGMGRTFSRRIPCNSARSELPGHDQDPVQPCCNVRRGQQHQDRER